MTFFESMEASFNPHIPVVLRALVERHFNFGYVGYKNSPTGEPSELLDRFFISVNHQRKTSYLHHFKGGFRAGAASAGIFFLRCYRLVDFKIKVLLHPVSLQYFFGFDPERIGGVFRLGLEFGQFALGFIQTVLKRFFLTLRVCMAATDHPSFLPWMYGPVVKSYLHLFIDDKSFAYDPVVILILLRRQHNFLEALRGIQNHFFDVTGGPACHRQ